MPVPSTETVIVVVIATLTVGGATVLGTASFGDTTESQVNQQLVLQSTDVPGVIDTDERETVSLVVGGPANTSELLVRASPVQESGEGTQIAQRAVNLSANETREVQFEIVGNEFEPGEYRLTLLTREQNVTLGTLAVMQPPTLAIKSAERQMEVVHGQSTSLSAELSNVGDYGGPAMVQLGIASEDEGSLVRGEKILNETMSLAPGETARVELNISPTALDLDPGEYSYWLASESNSDSITGRLTVLAPAQVTVQDLNAPTNVTRGERMTMVTTVQNVGDVPGNSTVTVRRGDQQLREANVSLQGGERSLMEFSFDTQAMERGNYTYTVTAENGTTDATVRVREPRFGVSNLRGNETLTIGDPMVFAADISNTGDANGSATIEYRLDTDDDDKPDRHNITKQVTLTPGETASVEFQIPYLEEQDPLNQVSTLPVGTHIYGIYTVDENETSVFDARQPSYSGGFGGGSSEGSSDESLQASRDEISQEKYGLYYEDLSGETRGQVSEIHKRQPFANGLSITQVLTREEIARQSYGVSVEPGEEFDFTTIDGEVQQEIEADFDTQFEGDEGDRVESWDELALERYDASFEALNRSRQSTIKDAYWKQFET